MIILLILLAITVIVVAYVLWLRPMFRKTSMGQGFLAAIEPFELWIYKKSETILFARFKMLVGVLLAILTTIGTIDITPLMPFVPDDYEPMIRALFNLSPLLITLLGWVDEWLRYDTTKPIDAVAVPDNAPTEVKAAVARVEATNRAAVATVKEAQAEGAM